MLGLALSLAWASMQNNHFVSMGTYFPRGYEQTFGLSRADRRQHLFMIGRTGTGKSTLLQNMIIQDIEAGEGLGLIDPHGDLAEQILNRIPPWRADDVVYFNPADGDFPIGFNILTKVPSEQRDLVASGVVSVFKSLWRDSWGPRLEYILYAGVLALLECENTSLLGLQRMLIDERYRQWVVKQVSDPSVAAFWTYEFESYERRFRQEAIAPIQNKIGRLLLAAPIRNILGQVKSRIDPGFMMDNRRIFIANLSKGRLGEDTANLLGSILVTSFQLAALRRADTPESERIDFQLFIDEFSNFTTDTFTSILSEARKYRLGLALVSQYLDQVPENIRHAVMGNVGNLISFRVSERDAAVLHRDFGYFPAQIFSELSNYEVCAKLLHNGEQSDPFIGQTLPSLGTNHQNSTNLIHRSRERFGTHRTIVESKHARWLRR